MQPLLQQIGVGPLNCELCVLDKVPLSAFHLRASIQNGFCTRKVESCPLAFMLLKSETARIYQYFVIIVMFNSLYQQTHFNL